VDAQSALTPAPVQPDSAETLVADTEPVEKTTGVFSVQQLLGDPLEFEVALNEALNRIKACLRLGATETVGRMIKAKLEGKVAEKLSINAVAYVFIFI
jgi:hypothetical protein